MSLKSVPLIKKREQKRFAAVILKVTEVYPEVRGDKYTRVEMLLTGLSLTKPMIFNDYANHMDNYAEGDRIILTLESDGRFVRVQQDNPPKASGQLIFG